MKLKNIATAYIVAYTEDVVCPIIIEDEQDEQEEQA